jgi:oxygen-dependent protoporphyrinogen oxidase
MKKIAIIGGGLAGLVCAWKLERLKKQNGGAFETVLFESGGLPGGGTIQTEKRDGFILEKGPDSFLSEKPWALELARELGIASEIIGTREENRKVFVVKKDRLIPLPEGFYLAAPTNVGSFLKSPLFSLPAKLRMMGEVLVPKAPAALDESVASFIRRRFGREALELAGQPMIAGIHSGDPERLSLLSTLPRFKTFESQDGSVIRGLLKNLKNNRQTFKNTSGPRYSLFLSFREGMQTLTQALASELPRGVLRPRSEIIKISTDFEGSQWRITEQSGQMHVAQGVCLAMGAGKAGRVLAGSFPKLAGMLSKIHYQSVGTVNFAYRKRDVSHPLDGFGFVVPASEKKSLIACTFSSQKFPNRAPEGFALLRAFVGGAFGQSYFEMEDGSLIEAARKDLKLFLGIKNDPVFSSLSRYPDSMPQYEVGHAKLVSEIEAELALHQGLFLTGSSYHGTGIPDCVHDAATQAEKIHKLLI